MKQVLVIFFIFISTQHLSSQHCEPIYNSYLNKTELSITGNKLSDISLKISFFRNGGPVKDAHQIYVFLFDADKEQILKRYLKEKEDSLVINFNKPDKFFKKISDYTKIIDNKLITKKNPEKYFGEYYYEYSITKADLQKFLSKSFHIKDVDLQNKVFKLFVVIPFLDSSYSNIKELPENSHDCNSSDMSYLVSTVLPYNISFIKYTWIKELIIKIKNI